MNNTFSKKIIFILYGLLAILFSIFISRVYHYYKYYKIEQAYISAVEFLYENNAIANGYTKNKITLSRKEINSLLINPSLDANCNGYVDIFPCNQGPKYKAYIICKDDYVTKGFDDKHLN